MILRFLEVSDIYYNIFIYPLYEILLSYDATHLPPDMMLKNIVIWMLLNLLVFQSINIYDTFIRMGRVFIVFNIDSQDFISPGAIFIDM